jgi:hypothetical protein
MQKKLGLEEEKKYLRHPLLTNVPLDIGVIASFIYILPLMSLFVILQT